MMDHKEKKDCRMVASETHPHTHDAGGGAEGGEGGAKADPEAAGGPKDSGVKKEAAGRNV